MTSLPENDATLEEMIRFADAYNPTPHFRGKQGESYASSVRALSGRYVQAYKAGHAASGLPDELLMCFAYDIVLGPHLGVTEPHKVGFLRWLLDGLRQALRRPTA